MKATKARQGLWKSFSKNMEFNFTFLPEFEVSLQKLPKKHQKQVLKKIKMIRGVKDQSIFAHVKPLAMQIGQATHRLKMSEYRIFVKVVGQNFEFQGVQKRGDAYKGK